MIRALEVLYSLGVLDDDAKLTSPVGFQAAEIPLVCCLLTIVEIFGFYCWIVYLCTSFSHLWGIIMNFFLEWNTCSKHIFYLVYPLDDKMRKCSKRSIVTSKRSYCSSAQPDAFVWFVFQLFCIFFKSVVLNEYCWSSWNVFCCIHGKHRFSCLEFIRHEIKSM